MKSDYFSNSMQSEYLCEPMKNLSEKIYDFMMHVETLQEETITEYLMWQWSLIDTRVGIIKRKRLHTKVEESKTGADFEIELWVLCTGKAIPFLIQAKKIIKPTNAYCSNTLNYNKSKPEKQYQLLLKEASRKRMTPLYIFYTKKSSLETLYIAEVDAVKKLAEACTKKSGTVVTRDEILKISKNLIFTCEDKVFDFLNKMDIGELTINLEDGAVPEYIAAYITEGEKIAQDRNIIILDTRENVGTL